MKENERLYYYMWSYLRFSLLVVVSFLLFLRNHMQSRKNKQTNKQTNTKTNKNNNNKYKMCGSLQQSKTYRSFKWIGDSIFWSTSVLWSVFCKFESAKFKIILVLMNTGNVYTKMVGLVMIFCIDICTQLLRHT